MPVVHLDYNAGAPAHPRAAEAVARALAEGGNASSAHALGRRARGTLERAREAVADLFGVAPSAVILTSGATEACHLALHGTLALPPAPPPRVVASAVEHEAVAAPLHALAEAGAIDLTVVPPAPDGVVDAAAVAAALEPPGVALVALMAANNEVGAVQPHAEVAALCRAAGATMLCDAAQLPGRGLDPRAVSADLIAISAHKLGGPPGIGALVRRGPVALRPVMRGGPQEGGLRAGTENVPGAAGLAAAIEALRAGELGDPAGLRGLAARLRAGIARIDPTARVLGPQDEARRLPQTLAVLFPGADGEALLAALDLEGVAVSSGSACASGALAPSPVLLAMGLDERDARCVIRLSFGWATTVEEIDAALAALERVLGRVRRG